MIQKPVPLKEVLTKTLKDLGLLEKAKRYQVFSIWKSVVGSIALHATPRKLSDGVLYVSTSTSAWAQELDLLKRKILSAINKALGGNYIEDIRFSEHLWDAYSEQAKRRRRSRGEVMGKGLEGDGARREVAEPGPDETKKQYFRTLSGQIKDERLQKAFFELASTLEGRKASLLQNGFVACPKCGYLYPGSQKVCPQCRYREDFFARKKAEALLSRNPEMSNLAASVALDIDDVELFQRVREELEDRWIRSIRRNISLAGRQPRLKEEILTSVRLLLSSRKNNVVNHIDWEQLEKILGSRLVREMKDVLKDEVQPVERHRGFGSFPA